MATAPARPRAGPRKSAALPAGRRMRCMSWPATRCSDGARARCDLGRPLGVRLEHRLHLVLAGQDLAPPADRAGERRGRAHPAHQRMRGRGRRTPAKDPARSRADSSSGPAARCGCSSLDPHHVHDREHGDPGRRPRSASTTRPYPPGMRARAARGPAQ